VDARLRLLAEAAGICQITNSGEFSKVNSEIIPWIGATSPRFFKAGFLILLALVIPGFFVLMWFMSRRRKKKAPPDKENL
jgi:uncharacterized BrkB/YihY/UPF0761 family membrane protein